ncbi:hypothetical protein OCS_06603 [Ophiocordyceps sinensis CO18]|uniref:Uncharacterized protein n=1 Tax=Ophiocordyceps sinensis (strain Co18 / CGMCC 3.14243) TaxID=911162 RepID=T5A543_OPHSC|nr:hypothetical protein OCS_06603 [Ophiocordyceps sinensis CO18]
MASAVESSPVHSPPGPDVKRPKGKPSSNPHSLEPTLLTKGPVRHPQEPLAPKVPPAASPSADATRALRGDAGKHANQRRPQTLLVGRPAPPRLAAPVGQPVGAQRVVAAP